MAGTNQHNIPQSHLRSFRAPGGSKKGSKTWLFGIGVAPRLVIIKDEVAVEEPNFYSTLSIDGSQTLDDHITDYEGPFAIHLQSLKGSQSGGALDAKVAAEVVAHLTIRNAHLRRTFASGMQNVMGRAVELFCDETKLRSLLGVDGKAVSENIKKCVDEELAKNAVLANTRLPARQFYRIAQMLLKEKFNRFFSENRPLMMTILSTMAAQAPEAVRTGHNKALSSGFAPDRRTEFLSALSWSVWQAPDGGLIMPDCVALGMDDETGFKPLLMADLEKVATVLMPLSSTKMLVGVQLGQSAPDLKDFNRAAAACSSNYFIGATEKHFEHLSKLIGKYSDQFIQDSTASIIKEFTTRSQDAEASPIQVPLSEATDQGEPSLVADDAPAPSKTPRYTLHFLGCADQETAERIAAIMFAVTNELCKQMPLDRLDGITFASDYPAALRDLDRGFLASAPLQPTNEDYGVGIAMAPLVVRDHVFKTHIVMRGDIGHCLISNEEASCRFALHTVVQQLAHAGCVQILDEALPGILLSKPQDNYDAFLYPYVESAWEGYFTSRASASFNPEAGEGYREILTAVLKRAQIEIPAARFAYRFHGDLDQLLKTALPMVHEILRFSGTLLGHYDGLGQAAIEDGNLVTALDAASLGDWIVLFDAELSELWNGRGNWTSFHEFLALNHHVERLLWQFGLIPWKTEEGQIRVEIPLGTDAAKLANFNPSASAQPTAF